MLSRRLDKAQLPIAMGDLQIFPVHHKIGAGWNLKDAAIERCRSENIPKPQVFGDAVDGDSRLDPGTCKQRLDLRGEGQCPPVERVEEGLLPGTVSRKDQPPPPIVPQREREHSVQMLNESVPE